LSRKVGQRKGRGEYFKRHGELRKRIGRKDISVGIDKKSSGKIQKKKRGGAGRKKKEPREKDGGQKG